MDSLPDTLLIEIFRFLPASDICKVSQVNKKFYNTASGNYLWRDVFINRWEIVPLKNESYKQFYAELNNGVNKLIHQHQKEIARLQHLLASERERQMLILEKRLESKRIRKSLSQVL
jgi:hypothetical protein